MTISKIDKNRFICAFEMVHQGFGEDCENKRNQKENCLEIANCFDFLTHEAYLSNYKEDIPAQVRFAWGFIVATYYWGKELECPKQVT